MTKENPDWKDFRDKNLGPENQKRVVGILAELGLPHRVISDDSGFWVMMEKER